MRVKLGLLGVVAIVATIVVGWSAVPAGQSSGGNAIRGRKVYLKANCYGCHGGRGGGGMGKSLREERESEAEAILDGTGSGMPAYRGILTSAEISDVGAYIRSLRTAAEPTFTHWWEAVPSQ
jgi:cytochrome c551